MPTVHLVGNRKQSERLVSVSLERTQLVLADVRKALPQLKKELSKQWPVIHVEIDYRRPRARNPFNPSDVVKAACLLLMIRFLYSAADSAGKETGTTTSREILKYVQRWLKNLGKRKTTKRARRPRT